MRHHEFLSKAVYPERSAINMEIFCSMIPETKVFNMNSIGATCYIMYRRQKFEIILLIVKKLPYDSSYLGDLFPLSKEDQRTIHYFLSGEGNLFNPQKTCVNSNNYCTYTHQHSPCSRA